MPLFTYEFTHDSGAGSGTVEAKNAGEAEKLIKDSLVAPGTAVDAKKQPKPKGLKVTVKKQ